MAKSFNRDEWKKIRKLFDEDPYAFGLPKRVYGSVVLASFNIRKLGQIKKRNAATWDFLADVCRHFDLLAVQEVSDNLEGVRHLESSMGSEFGMIVSDGTGAFPGSSGLTERMAFIFNWSMVHRKEIATDVTYDRSKLLLEISKGRPEINAAFDEYEAKLTAYKNKERKTKPMLKMPKFLSFIRSPYCVVSWCCSSVVFS